MARRIDGLVKRFKGILRGQIKKHLRKYISSGELIGRKGKDLVSIPLPQINLPRFRFGSRGHGGAGQGEGEPGTPLGPGQGEPGGGAGDQPGGHIIEVDVDLDELAEILGEELELPRMNPKNKKNLEEFKLRYTSARRVGPESLRITKRMLKSALRRFACGLPKSVIRNPAEYNRYLKAAMAPRWAKRPLSNVPPFYIVKDDKWYRSWKTYWEKRSDAVLINMMDVSGSMTDEQKELVRITSSWVDLWVDAEYKGMEHRYIVHDAEATEVDGDTFYHTRESGGTKISSAYKLFDQMTGGVENYRSQFGAGYSPDETNIYGLHFSDGDNWSEDNSHCLEILDKKILPNCQLFGYVQVESSYGSGQFIRELKNLADKHPNLALAEVESKDDIYDALKAILGKEGARHED